jgi:probable O-glycosylation ligase (exosortase A-associated)
MKDLLFLLIFLPILVLAVKNPFLGLCGWVWTMMAVPKNMLWGAAGDIRFTYVLALVTIIGMILNKDPLRRLPFKGIFLLMLLFLAHTAISNSLTMGTSHASWKVWIDFFKAILLSGLIVSLLTTKNRIETFLFALLLGIGFNIFFEGLKFIATGGAYSIVGIKHSMMTDNNLFALAILMVLPLYMYIIPQVKHKYLKLCFTGLAGLSAVCVIGSYSRGGFIGLVVVGWQIFTKVKRKAVFVLFAVMFASVAVYIAAEKWTDRIQTIEHAENDSSFIGRTTAWKLSVLSAMDNPILGVGQDSMQHYHVWSYYYDDIGMFDFITEKNTPKSKAKAAHSIYFQVLGDAGFVGLLIFLTIMLKGLFLARKLSKKGSEDWIRQLGKAIQTGLFVFLISGGLLSFAYYDLLYALISILVCLDLIEKDKIKNSP